MLQAAKRIHFIGIGGIGVSGVARIALAQGFSVSGSDVRRSQLTEAVAAEGAQVFIGHSEEQVEGADLVVVSTAIPETNLEWQEALKRGIPTIHRSQLLTQLVQGYRTIGVTGTHGKGTVSAMITRILESAGFEPGFIIGGLVLDFGTNARLGGGEWMVLEVDESDGSHHRIPTDYLVCNFLEADHLNYYDDLDHIISSMLSCIQSNPELARVFLNLDCSGNRTLLQSLAVPHTTYALDTEATIRGALVNDQQYPIRFSVDREGHPLGIGSLSIPGRYNVTNALAAISVALELQIPFELATEALAGFQGLENRFSIVEAGELTIVKDYISHPTGMRQVLKSASAMAKGRIFTVWKPYRYTLLNYLQDEYATAFEGSYEVILTTMYAANEDPIEGIDTQFIADKIRQSGMSVTYVPLDADLISTLESKVRPGDEVVFFGGDDYFQLADAWAESLRRRNRAILET